MPLTVGFHAARDLLEKLEREARSLRDGEVTADCFMNFVLTAYALIDWIKNDPTVPSLAKQQSVIQGLYAAHSLKICGDIATSVKYFTLSRRVTTTKDTTVKRGGGSGQFGVDGFGVGNEEIVITLNDGSVKNALGLVQDVLATWRAFFSTYNI